MEKITFLNPEFFWLFLLLPVVIAWLFWKKNQQVASLKVSSTAGFQGERV